MSKVQEREQMKIVIVGHVDHGKSTLVGRLFHDTDSLPEGKLEQIKAQCERRGMPFEYSFLMDALQAERDQGITIDTTQIWFKTDRRDYVIIDAPGHKEFLKNMISGAANSEAAVLLIDANEGVKEQSKRHGYLLSLLGVSQVAVAVNKMDLVGYSEERFREIEKEYTEYLNGLGVKPTHVVPISAREGDNITEVSKNMPWYKGDAVLQALDNFKLKPADTELPLRFPVQDVYKFDERRIIAGRIESGKVSVGDEIIFSPINRVVKVNSIEMWSDTGKANPTTAYAGQSVGLTLSEQIFAERGHIVSHNDNSAPVLTNLFRAKIFWLGDESIEVGKTYTCKITNSEYTVTVKEIERVIDTDNLSDDANAKVQKNQVAEIIFRVRGLAALDEFEANSITGRFVLIDNYRIQGGGIIDMRGFENQREEVDVKSENIFETTTNIDPKKLARANGHKGGVLWFSGLSGSGKTTIARAVNRALFAKGYQSFVLDGDNTRNRLNADLGFSEEDRHENLRRIGITASLFAEAGSICIAAFISPYKEDRDRARVATGENFHLIYVKASVEKCEERDVKGLYAKARAGEIENFTGISAPFEEPDNADLVLDTEKLSVEKAVELAVEYVEKNLVITRTDLYSI